MDGWTSVRLAEMEQNKRRTGSLYEKAAGEYLEGLGYEVLEYNYRCRLGEIDLIAREGGYLVFCEVKYRRGGAGDPLEAVDIKKQQRLFLCAQYYLATHPSGGAPCRFDVVGFAGDRVTLIKNAFEGN